MDIPTTILFALGLLLQVMGFLLGSAEHIPPVLRLFSPFFVEAQEGVQILEERKSIGPGDRGFDQIAEIVLREARTDPPGTMQGISVQEVRLQGIASLSFRETEIRQRNLISVLFSNGQRIDWSLQTLKEQVKGHKRRNLFAWAVWLFVVGFVLQIVGFYLAYTITPGSAPTTEADR